MGKRGQRGRGRRSGAACGWRWADREVELVWGAADMQLGEWMERSRWGHEKRPIRNLFTDVNDSSWESEPPTVLWCLSQTFVCLLGGLEMRSCHISAHMKAVREILSLTPIFQNGSLQVFFPYENYFYQLFHQQVSASPPGTTHTTSTGLPQSEIYPFCLLLLTSWCLEEELGMVLCCSMHTAHGMTVVGLHWEVLQKPPCCSVDLWLHQWNSSLQSPLLLLNERSRRDH